MSLDAKTRRAGAMGLHQPWNGEAVGEFSHFLRGNLFGLGQGCVGGRDQHVLEQLGVGWIQGLGIDFDGGQGSVASGDDFHGTAAAGGFDGFSREVRLDLFHLPLDASGLFHEFSDAGHGGIVGGLA